MIASWVAPISIAANAATLCALGYGFYKFIMRAFAKMIDERVHPRLEDVTSKLTDHMGQEDAERKAMTKSLRKTSKQVTVLQETLDDRAALFDNLNGTLQETQTVLKAHMQHDEEVLALAQSTLSAGQQRLEARLDTIERKSDTIDRKIGDLGDST